jgi:hypothetical protein
MGNQDEKRIHTQAGVGSGRDQEAAIRTMATRLTRAGASCKKKKRWNAGIIGLEFLLPSSLSSPPVVWGRRNQRKVPAHRN